MRTRALLALCALLAPAVALGQDTLETKPAPTYGVLTSLPDGGVELRALDLSLVHSALSDALPDEQADTPLLRVDPLVDRDRQALLEGVPLDLSDLFSAPPGLALEDPTLAAVTELRALAAGRGGPSDTLSLAADALDRAWTGVYDAVGERADTRRMIGALDGAQAALLADMPTDDAGFERRRAHLEAVFILRRTKKAIYQRDDNYSPLNYVEMYKASRGGVALYHRSSTRAHCSGVLLGSRWVLTARHCVDRLSTSNLEVGLDFENDLAGRPLPVKRFKVEHKELLGKKWTPQGVELDIAMLRLAPDVEGKHAGDHASDDTCILTSDLAEGDAVYVVGHPLGQPRVIHDNAHVLFPHLTTSDALAELRAMVELEAASMGDRETVLREFDAAWQAVPGAGDSETLHRYVPSRWGGQPVFAIDSDTYRGDSGAPVYTRRGHKLVGILIAGESDDGGPLDPGFVSHEAIIPTSVINEHLDAHWPGWADQMGVCVN